MTGQTVQLQKQRPYRLVEWTIGASTLTEISYVEVEKRINKDPIGQRFDTDNPIGKKSPSKSQSILNEIFSGFDIGEIKLATTPEEEDYDQESIDGANRKRTITGFMGGEFPTHSTSVIGEKYYAGLTKEELDIFHNYKLRLIIWEGMTAAEIGHQFRVSNNQTLVNHQQMLNSYGNILIANLIRNTVRVIRGVNNLPHSLFESTSPNNFRFLGFGNKGMKQDEIVARLVARIHYNLIGVHDRRLEDMYREDFTEQQIQVIKKKLYELLDFVFEVAKAKKATFKSNLTFKELILLLRLHFNLKETYKKFNVPDWNIFYKQFRMSFDRFQDKSANYNSDYDKTVASVGIKEGDTESAIFAAFNGYLQEHSNVHKMKQSLKWFLAEFDVKKYIRPLDPKRLFSKEEIESQWLTQDGKDWVDGNDLPFENAVGAHVESHSDGGRTAITNLVVTSEYHNRRMSSQHAYSYKEAVNN